MKTINNNPRNVSQFGSRIEEIFNILLMREAQNLLMKPDLDSKMMTKLNTLMSLYYKCVKTDAREDYRVYIQNNNLEQIDTNDPFYKQLQSIIAETPQITSDE